MTSSNPMEILQLAGNGYALARSVRVVGRLGVADQIDGKLRSAEELAELVGADADALQRVMRLLAANGIFEMCEGRFGHSEASRMLRRDHPHTMLPLLEMLGLPIFWRVYEELEYSVVTGRAAIEKVIPEGFWRYLAEHPEENSAFNLAMAVKAQGQIPAIIGNYDFGSMASIADIGGGRGHLLRAILASCPKMKGVLFDQPHVIAESAKEPSQGVILQAGDFFADRLPACDGYLLMEILHDWPDGDSVRILRAIRAAAPPHARLLVLESLIRDQPGPDWLKVLDIHMLVLFGGRQRTLEEYKAILGEGGFLFSREIDTGAGISLIEALPN